MDKISILSKGIFTLQFSDNFFIGKSGFMSMVLIIKYVDAGMAYNFQKKYAYVYIYILYIYIYMKHETSHNFIFIVLIIVLPF